MLKMSNEVKTGGVIVLSVALLLGLLYKMGDLNIKKDGYFVTTEFGFAAGVRKFAPVRLAGVEVGEVRDINILYEENATKVEATLWIEEGAKVRTDANAMVSTMGLMGEKYVEIEGGSAATFVEPGGQIEGQDPVKLEKLFQKASRIGDELEVTLKEIRHAATEAKELLRDNKPKLDRIFTNLDGILDSNRPKIDNILSNLEETSEYFKEFAEDVKHHPWKVLMKGKEKSPEELARLRAERKARKLKEKMGEEGVAVATPTTSSSDNSSEEKSKKQNKGFLIF